MNKIICVDFDGTCVTHEYPEIGQPIECCQETLWQLQQNGVKLILWTMRHGEALEAAVNWFKERQIELWGINENPQQKEWTNSPKCYGQVYIDDAALGCPLIYPVNGSRPFVNWVEVARVLEEKEFLPKNAAISIRHGISVG